LRDAVAERPVLLLDLDKTDEDVFAAKAGIVREKRLAKFGRSIRPAALIAGPDVGVRN
jgi:hypothetical protein